MTRRVGAFVLLALAIMVVALTGCVIGRGSMSSSGQTSAGSTPAASVPVAIQRDALGPRVVTVNLSETVTWTNKDASPHSVSGTGFVSGAIAPGATFSNTFHTAGTYNYLCTIHPNMVGIVVVK